MDQAEPQPAVEPPKRPDRPNRPDRLHRAGWRLPAEQQHPEQQHPEQQHPEQQAAEQQPADRPPRPGPDLASGSGQAPGLNPDVPVEDQGPAPDHPVVVGFDGSPASRNALAYAAGMARRLERPLLVVYVTARGIYCEPLSGQVIRTVSDHQEISRWLLAELDQVCGADDLQVHTTTRCGTPARELAAAAAEYSADALVIGASSQAWHQLVGSVPGWLARHVQCPVVVVP